MAQSQLGEALGMFASFNCVVANQVTISYIEVDRGSLAVIFEGGGQRDDGPIFGPGLWRKE